MKSEYDALVGMTPRERGVFLRTQYIAAEEERMNQMIGDNRWADDFAGWCTMVARRCVADYDTFNDESMLDTAERFTELAKLTRASKYTVKDIRNQREKIQWERRQLKKLSDSSIESEASSKSSAN